MAGTGVTFSLSEAVALRGNKGLTHVRTALRPEKGVRAKNSTVAVKSAAVGPGLRNALLPSSLPDTSPIISTRQEPMNVAATRTSHIAIGVPTNRVGFSGTHGGDVITYTLKRLSDQ